VAEEDFLEVEICTAEIYIELILYLVRIKIIVFNINKTHEILISA